MSIEEILLECEEHMEKTINYLKGELRGIRTGRASPAMVEYVKVDYYGSTTDLRQLAQVTVPEPTQLMIKPYDASAVKEVSKAIQEAGLGLNPQIDGKAIRLNVPPLSTDRRKQLANSIKQMGEQSKVAIRNARRDANKHVDAAEKDKSQHIAEDVAKDTKDEINDLTKKYESTVVDMIDTKTKEVMED